LIDSPLKQVSGSENRATAPSQLTLATVTLMSILLSGCASDPPKPDQVPEVSRPVVAEVGVRERCRVELPAEPAWLFTGVAADSLFDFYRRALAEIQQRIQHERELRAAAKKCE